MFRLKNLLFSRLKKIERPSFTSIYGENFPKPSIEDFGLTVEEYRKLVNSFKKSKQVLDYQNALKIYYKIQQEKIDSQDGWL